MRWSERQQAMLREMGVALWQPGLAPELASDAPPAADEPKPMPAPAVLRQTLVSPPAGVPAPVDAHTSAALPERVARDASPDLSSLDWPALADRVAACQACGLCKTRTQTVFGVGHHRAHWMIVGEAPGEQEDLQGEPFVGAAGRLLDRMLLSLGLSRQDGEAAQQVYIANTLKCRPPRNRNPEPDELAQCLPFLERQVALVQPRVVLAMGRFAVQALLGSAEPIGRLRGRVHDWQGRPLVVTYHPAYLLRQPTEKARAWADLCLAAEALDRANADRAR